MGDTHLFGRQPTARSPLLRELHHRMHTWRPAVCPWRHVWCRGAVHRQAHSSIRSRHPPPIHTAWCVLLERRRSSRQCYHTFGVDGAGARLAYSFIRSRQPSPIHTAWCLQLKRKGAQVSSVFHTWCREAPTATVRGITLPARNRARKVLHLHVVDVTRISRFHAPEA